MTRVGRFATVLLWATLFACQPTPSTETLKHHIWVDLSTVWDRPPWDPEKDATGRPLPQSSATSLQAKFTLPADAIGHGSVLLLEGLTWTADVSVNGQALPPITGSVGLTEVHLGNHLRGGDNTITVDINGPEGVHPLLVGHENQAATLATAPRLLLRPQVGIDHVIAH